MKTIQIEIPDGKQAEWVNGVLTLTDEPEVEYKFNVGDKVIFPLFSKDKAMTITEQLTVNGCPCYNLKSYNNIYIRGGEDEILPYIPQDITERIKTFEDACKWCNEKSYDVYTSAYNVCIEDMGNDDRVKDIIAYLKLRIITVALNDGWEPDENDIRYTAFYNEATGDVMEDYTCDCYYGCDSSISLCFKSKELALYAAKQFKDIYSDFCGCKKGGEK